MKLLTQANDTGLLKAAIWTYTLLCRDVKRCLRWLQQNVALPEHEGNEMHGPRKCPAKNMSGLRTCPGIGYALSKSFRRMLSADPYYRRHHFQMKAVHERRVIRWVIRPSTANWPELRLCCTSTKRSFGCPTHLDKKRGSTTLATLACRQPWIRSIPLPDAGVTTSSCSAWRVDPWMYFDQDTACCS